MRRHIHCTLGLCLLLGACTAPLRLEYRPGQVRSATGRGMVVAEDPTAAAVGAAVLGDGGNAVDAAVATAFAMAVTYPQAGPPGGGGFAVVSLPGLDPAALDFRETAPAAATKDMFLRPDGTVDRALSLRSLRSVGVPGMVAGMAALHEKHGRLPWARLVEPAVALAADGFDIPAGLADALNEHRKRLLVDADAARVFVREDRDWRPGDRLVQADLARTLAAIRDRSAEGFYAGATAKAIVAKMAAGGGILTADDLAAYRPVWREPARFEFRGREVVTMPLPSSAGVVLHRILAVYDAAGGAARPSRSPDGIHLFVEASRRAFADRNALLGDPAGVPAATVRGLTASERLKADVDSIDPLSATPSFEIRPTPPDPADTTHLCVVDGAGGAVALTYSLNVSFGSHIVVGGTGILLNDHMDDFSARPGASNAYGLRQGESNTIVPGRRPLSSMSPTLVRDGDEVVLVVGAAGGPRILSTVAQVVLHHVGDGVPLDLAVLVPRIHHQHLPDRLDYEEAHVVWPMGRVRTDLLLSPAVLRSLEERGHVPRVRPKGIARLTALSRDAATGRVLGVAGPRTYGSAEPEWRDAIRSEAGLSCPGPVRGAPDPRRTR